MRILSGESHRRVGVSRGGCTDRAACTTYAAHRRRRERGAGGQHRGQGVHLPQAPGVLPSPSVTLSGTPALVSQCVRACVRV